MTSPRPLKPALPGYVLLVTLSLVALLTVTGAVVYQQSESRRLLMNSMKGQSLASARAKLGIQKTLAQLENSAALMQQVLALQPSANLGQAREANQTVEVEEHGSDALPIDEGGGRRFRAEIYRRQLDTANSSQLVMISTGYYGSNLAPLERVLQSKVEIEFQTENSGSVVGGPNALF